MMVFHSTHVSSMKEVDNSRILQLAGLSIAGHTTHCVEKKKKQMLSD
jgi:hypothetical protein